MRTRLQNLGLRQKLLGTVSFALIATIVLAALTFRASNQSQHALDWVDHSRAVLQITNEIQSNVYAMQSNYRNFVLTGDRQFLSGSETALSNYTAAMSRLKTQTGDNSQQLSRWEYIETLVNTWQRDTVQPGIALRQQVDEGTASLEDAYAWITSDTGRQSFSTILGEITTGALVEQNLLIDRIEAATDKAGRVQNILLAGTALVVLLSLAAAVIIANDVSFAMSRLTHVAQRVREGDYSQQTDVQRSDEIGQAAVAFDSMSRTLQETIANLHDTAQRAHQSETQIRAVLDNVAEGIVTFTPTGVIQSVNPAARDMFKFPDGELVGMPIGTIVSIGSTPVQANTGGNLSQISTERPPLPHDAMGFRADGSSFPVEIVLSRVSMPDASRFIAVVRNVSPLVEAERRLRIRNSDLESARGIGRAVLDATGEGVVLISPMRSIVTINKRFSEFFGVEEADVAGQPITRFGDLLDRVFPTSNQFRVMLEEMLDDSDAHHSALITQQWPVHRELEYFTTPVKTRQGELLGRLFSFRDVTHEREVDRMKTEFVSLVSHELRTPLTSIKGYVDLLREGEVGDLEPEQQEFLEIVSSNADRLVALIGDLLDISRIEAGKIELSLTANDLHYVLNGLALSFRPQLETKHQTLELSVPADTPAVQADTARLNQILTNLLSNAHKYSPAGSTINIDVGYLDETVSIAVRDAGVGLSPAELERLFTRFFRASNRATQEAGGTGLGLAITRSLVELHGGAISVESEPGKGSIFTVTLPAAPGSAPATPPETEKPGETSRSGGKNILIVEDEPDIASLMRRYLERAGFQVTTASNASNALHMVRRIAFDLITLDVLLPDSDGFTVLETLKNDPETRDIPVMMLSMLPDEGEGRRLGAVEYLVKPVAENTLVDHIHHLLASTHVPAAATILIADDDAGIRELLARTLARQGYTVLTASNGIEAIALTQQHPVDLLLLDVRMPLMDGITALRHIRGTRETRDLAVVMMTASPGVTNELEPALAQLGVLNLLRKPLTAAELATGIQDALAHIRKERV